MKIQVLSDLHLEFNNPGVDYWYNPQDTVDCLVLAGDIHVGREAVQKTLQEFGEVYPFVLYVPGNHEFYRSKLDCLHNLDVPNNVYVLNPGTVLYRDYLFVGATLWTDFRGDNSAKLASRRLINDFRVIRDFDVDTCQKIHQEQREYIVQTCSEFQGYKKIVITHFLPSISCIHPRWIIANPRDPLNKYYANDMDWWLVNQVDTTCIFGHTHDHIDNIVGTTRLVCNPRGYPGENHNYNPHFTIEV